MVKEGEKEATTVWLEKEVMKHHEKEAILYFDNNDYYHLLNTLPVTDLGHLPTVVASQMSLQTAHGELGFQKL